MNPFFLLPPETAHNLALKSLDYLHKFCPSLLAQIALCSKPQKHMGIAFRNIFGTAAGLDKDAEHLDSLQALGFGFLEVGTLTPLAQKGNPKPRLFRLKPEQAILNRMGFNNKGLEAFLQTLHKRKSTGILGVNLGKNKDTPLEESWQDYVLALEKVYRFADYVVINISSPNTPQLRELLGEKYLHHLLSKICRCKEDLQKNHQKNYGKSTALVLKLSPDIEKSQLPAVFKSIANYPIDGLIISNTTVSRDGITHSRQYLEEAGGLSGAPLRKASLEVLEATAEFFQGRICLIASGGVMGIQDVEEKLGAGADLIQFYSGLVYRPIGLMKELRAYCLQADLPLK